MKFKVVLSFAILASLFACNEDQIDKKIIDVTEESRYNKVVLSLGLNEPTEFVVLPDKRIILTERRGAVKLFNPDDNSLREIAKIPVYSEQEDGLMGIALDPNFEYNSWLYLYYSPEGPEEKQHLSRFSFNGETIDTDSEIVMLEVATQRAECCHTGGSIEFGPDGLLYLSTGDDTNPFGSEGFAPIDERAGRSPWDAQKSSANANDLRGKILRIRPMNDGTYEIPEGNLFPVGQEGTRPEIYVMGCRNPYRISIDQRRNWLFWGEVGPDAGKNEDGRGPRGHDEVNLAMSAGNFGWPYFVGDNKPYNRFDFGSKIATALYNPDAPKNLSPNNTGITDLPPAQKALIWYPYAYSEEFPMLGKGGRNAMAGPVFYRDDFDVEGYALPSYFDGKLFIYDWIRGWIFSVTLSEDGELQNMELFMPNTTFNYMIDMTMGPEGALYILEYGTGWFTKNDDAALVRIEFNGGNRKPVIELAASANRGAAPLTVDFSSAGTFDYDNDKLSYKWEIEGEVFNDSIASYTFDKPGIYYPKLTVKDVVGNSEYRQLIVEVGNDEPDIDINLTGNQTFYWPEEKRSYKLTLEDAEDGKLGDQIPESRVAFSIDYLAEGLDLAGVNQSLGHQVVTKGERLLSENDCKSCHKIKEKSIGPSYEKVAIRYASRTDAIEYLSDKVINGGAGNWGEQAMAAHPSLSKSDAEEIVKYILSLGTEKEELSFSLTGNYAFDKGETSNIDGMYVLTASYEDNGANGMESILSKDQIILRNPLVEAESFDEGNQVVIFDFKDEQKFVNDIYNNSFISFKSIDLTEVEEIEFGYLRDDSGRSINGVVELRLGSPEGKLAGQVSVDIPKNDRPVIKIEQSGKTDLYFVFKTFDNKEAKEKFYPLDWIYFRKNG